LDCFGKLAFGYDFQVGSSASEEAHHLQTAWVNQVNAGMEMSAFFAKVILRAFPFIISIPFESIRAQGRIKENYRRIAAKMIIPIPDAKPERNLLNNMMDYVSEGKLSTSQMLEHISTFVMVGHETTANALNFILWELARNQEIQERLREELASFDSRVTYDQCINPASFPLLDAVVKEGLRLHPPPGYAERTALQDDVIPLSRPLRSHTGQEIKEIRVQAGQVILIPHISINCLKSVWGNDNGFRPERWLEQDGLPPREVLPSGWSNLTSFGDGPRSCIGIRLALLELKVFVSAVVRNFQLHDTQATIETKFSATSQPRIVGRENEGAQLPIRVTLLPSP